MPSDSSAASRASTSPVCEPGHGVVLREHLDELGHEDGLPVHADHPPTIDVHDARRAVLHAVGKALVEDVLRQRDVVVGREHLGPRGEPEVDERARTAILRRAQALGRVRQRPRVTGHLPRFARSTDDADYFGLVAIVNGSC